MRYNQPVYFCDPHSVDDRQVLADHYVVHIDGPDGPQTWTIDLCTDRQVDESHDTQIRGLLDFLATYGDKIVGAELILPEDRKVVIPHQSTSVALDARRAETPVGPPALPSGATDSEEDDAPEDFYDHLIRWCRDEGITLADLAEKAGLHPQSLYRLRRNPPSPRRVRAILEVMGFSGDALRRLMLRYGQERPEHRRADRKFGPLPRVVEIGDRKGGLNEAAVWGDGKPYGVDPRG